MGQRLRDGLDSLAAKHDWVAEVRGRGLMLGIELVEPGTTEPSKERTVAMHEGAKKHGLLVGKGGLYGNVLRLAPMMNLTAEEADEGVAALHAAADEIN